MKWIIKSLLLLFPIIAVSQYDYGPKNGIGIHLTNDGHGGFGGSIRYLRQIGQGGTMKFELKLNRHDLYNARIGYEFLKFRKDKFELGIGVDLNYRFWDLEQFGYQNINELYVELPIELRYHINSKYLISAGVSFGEKIQKNKFVYLPHVNKPEIRLGVGYKF